METISNYTIYCTEKQTRKARELGAPIEVKTIEDAPKEWYGKAYFTGMATCAKFPTADQMIEWLDGQDVFVNINHISAGYSSWLKTISTNENISENLGYVSTRKEAILAAIDAALDYLSNNKN